MLVFGDFLRLYIMLCRMETIYRLVLHESSLIKGDHPDSTVVSSLKLHRRDLLTAVETTKWQVIVYVLLISFVSCFCCFLMY